MNITDYLEQKRIEVDRFLDQVAPLTSSPPTTLHESMRYSLMAGGKRVRPILTIAAAEAIGVIPTGLMAVACSLEFIHTYSLIHDDLPALDNDDWRRGRPTNHKVFGEAIAILAGDALLTLAFGLLARLPGAGAQTRVELAAELAEAAGSQEGMIAGQVRDLEGEGAIPTPERLEAIHRAKTGALLRASVRMGGIYAGADATALAALTAYGEHIGLAFQIVDDVLDVEQSSQTLGKTAGKDAAQRKITFPAVYGVEESKRMAARELEAAHDALSPLGAAAHRLHELADYIMQRSA